jgi:hypothetical protein
VTDVQRSNHKAAPLRAVEPRHFIYCPVPRCGSKLGEVELVEGRCAVWRHCPDCKAVIRYELPDRAYTIVRDPARPPPPTY